MRAALVLFAFSLPALGQWTLQESHSTASLRGIHSIGNGIAWASGSNGTILRTIDNGKNWQACGVPPDGDKLDFRGIQGFDANTAIVMSSGKGDLSRLYQTTDGCKTWRLYKQNDEPDGFWDAVAFTASPNLVNSQDSAVLIGDPVRGCLQVFWLVGSKVWWPPRCGKGSMPRVTPLARDGESAFAASNSSALSFERGDYIFGTGGVSGARFFYTREELFPGSNDNAYTVVDSVEVPIGTKTASSGIFSLAERSRSQIVAVGGDYVEPNNSAATAAWSSDKGLHWQAATTPPHGYRSAVAYSPIHKAWITVGPNGTDISTDDGRNWRALRPSAGEAPDADQHWNALSLPFVVGSHGRIGILRDDALTTKN